MPKVRIFGYFEVSKCKDSQKNDIFVSLGSINKLIALRIESAQISPINHYYQLCGNQD